MSNDNKRVSEMLDKIITYRNNNGKVESVQDKVTEKLYHINNRISDYDSCLRTAYEDLDREIRDLEHYNKFLERMRKGLEELFAITLKKGDEPITILHYTGDSPDMCEGDIIYFDHEHEKIMCFKIKYNIGDSSIENKDITQLLPEHHKEIISDYLENMVSV